MTKSEKQTSDHEHLFLTSIGRDEKERQAEVKSLGARWNASVTRWEVPKDVAVDPFKAYLATEAEQQSLNEAFLAAKQAKEAKQNANLEQPAKVHFHKKGDEFLSSKIHPKKGTEEYELLMKAGARYDATAFNGRGCWYLPEDKLDNIGMVEQFRSTKKLGEQQSEAKVERSSDERMSYHKKGDEFLSSKIHVKKGSEEYALLMKAGAKFDASALDGRGCWFMPEDKLQNIAMVEQFRSAKHRARTIEVMEDDSLAEGMDAPIEDVVAARCGQEQAAEIQRRVAEREAERSVKKNTQTKRQSAKKKSVAR